MSFYFLWIKYFLTAAPAGSLCIKQGKKSVTEMDLWKSTEGRAVSDIIPFPKGLRSFHTYLLHPYR